MATQTQHHPFLIRAPCRARHVPDRGCNVSPLVKVLLRARNPKLGKRMAVTHLPIKQTCPSDCPLRDAGCYAQLGWGGVHMRRLERAAAAAGATMLDIARAEAEGIRELALRPGAVGTPLRLHHSGDLGTAAAVREVASAARFYSEEAEAPVYTYTHGWRRIARRTWDTVSILASVHSLAEGAIALARGYAPAVTVPQHAGPKAWRDDSGIKWIPCPEQTLGRTCEECKLCFDSEKLVENRAGIAFAAHGTFKEHIKRRLPLLAESAPTRSCSSGQSREPR